MSESDSVAAQLESFFGSSDLLQILGIKNREAYISAPSDPFTARQAYLRSVLRYHPDSACLSEANPEHFEDYVLRSKKLFILKDIYEFLSGEKDEIKVERDKYLEHGKLPELLSLEIINDASKCRKRFGIPNFEAVATELKEIFAVQMRKIKKLQEEESGN